MSRGRPGHAVIVTAVALSPYTAGPPHWQHSLCGCSHNTEICCEEFWCSYCHLGFIHEYLNTGADSMNAMGVLLCFLDVCCTLGTARCAYINHLRSRVLYRYGIMEGGCENFMTSCCCSSCAACQLHREMHERRDYTGGMCYKGAACSGHVRMGEPAGRPSQAQVMSYPPPRQPPPTQPQYAQYPQAQPVFAPPAGQPHYYPGTSNNSSHHPQQQQPQYGYGQPQNGYAPASSQQPAYGYNAHSPYVPQGKSV